MRSYPPNIKRAATFKKLRKRSRDAGMKVAQPSATFAKKMATFIPAPRLGLKGIFLLLGCGAIRNLHSRVMTGLEPLGCGTNGVPLLPYM